MSGWDSVDVTGYGDTTRQRMEIGEPITDPEVIARMDAERAERDRRWLEDAEAEARALGYDSLDEQQNDEYWHGPSYERRRKRDAREPEPRPPVVAPLPGDDDEPA